MPKGDPTNFTWTRSNYRLRTSTHLPWLERFSTPGHKQNTCSPHCLETTKENEIQDELMLYTQQETEREPGSSVTLLISCTNQPPTLLPR